EIGIVSRFFNYLLSILKEKNAELKKSNKNLSVKAYHDNLTKILNRNGFLKRLSEINNKYTLAIIDIDKFKSINDTYGHDVGDYVLKDLATLISNKIRTTDIFARWGGEEFVLVLDTPDLLQAQNISDNLRKEVENSKFKTVGKITISIGISEFKTKNDTFEDVFKKADQALYQAKMSGRNRVFVY
ncbi:MAG: GGDEF domain-containing protein, partial [Arcobacter sp.]|nr:GGDEF domain-containing protein [Arcobacter sp.]